MPPFEEGLIVPNFETAEEEKHAVLPPGFRDEIGMPPPEPTPPRIRTRFDPEGQGPRQGMTFGENFRGTLGSGTIEGSLDEAEALRIARGGVPMPETDAIGVGSGFVPELTPERADAARLAARDTVFDQIAYDLAPTNITPRGVAGSLAGQMAAPSNLLGFGGSVAARALGVRGFGATAQAAATMGIQAGATDLAVQGIRTTSGDQEHFEPLEAALAPVAGALLGAGAHKAGEALGKAAGGVAEFVRSRRAQQDALGIDLPREALPGAGDAARGQPEAVAGSLDRTAPAEAALHAEEPAQGMPAAEPDPAAPVSREQADGRAEQTAQAATDAPKTEPVEPARPVDEPAAAIREPAAPEAASAPPSTLAEPPPFKAATRAEWDNIRPAAAPDAPAWAPKIQSTLDELARGFDMEPPRVSVAKPKFDDAPLFGTNDRQGNILLAEGLSEHHALNNAVHEFGHEVQFRLYDTAPAETQDAIQAAFRAATARDAGTTSLNQLRPVTATRKLGDAGQPKRIKTPRTGDEPIPASTSAGRYQHSFEEWFAEQVSRWVTQDAKPVGVVERFFSGVADAWRKIYAKVAGHTPLDAEVKAFLDGRWQGSEAGRVTREPAPKFELKRGGRFDPDAPPKRPGELDRRVYDIMRDGQKVGDVVIKVDGDTAEVRSINSEAPEAFGYRPLSNSLGPRAMATILRQFVEENPQIKRLTGERVSGARRGGTYHNPRGTGEQVEIPIPTRRQAGALIGTPVPDMGVHRVTVPGREPIRVAPIVVEARDLKTSADAGFDPALQPRQRDRAASQEQIRDIATNLEPERLGVSAEADRGAPIVGGDSMVESGNGRVLAIRRAYEQGGEAADRYRDWLGRQGVDVSGFDEPVLVRQRLTDLSPEERRSFTDAANRTTTLAMSAPERALADARLISSDSLGLIRNANDLGAVANRDFVRSFVQALPQAERGALSTAEGGLSAEGLTRVRNAVLARAYGDAPVLSRITEATADDVRSISNALTAAAPDWAVMRAGIEAGTVRADVDLTAELLEAVTRTADIRGKGQRLDAFLKQQDAFDQLAQPVEDFMRMFYDPNGRRAAGGPRIAEALRAYATEARKITTEDGLALGLPEVTTGDLLKIAARRGGADDGGAQGLLYRRRARDGAGTADGRPAAQGPRSGGEGQDAGGARAGLGEAGEAGSRQAELNRAAEAHVRAEAESISDELFRKRAPKEGIEEPDQIQKGRPVEDQGTAPIEGDARPERLEELGTRFAADFETILRTGRVQAGARGQFNTGTGVARVRSLADLDTTIHEVGHSLQQSPQTRALVDPVVTGNRGELAPLGAGTGATGDAEAFAELFRLYATNRAYAERTYPNTTADLERTLREALPAQAAALDRLRTDLDVIHRADSGAVVGSDVITPKPDGLFRRMLKVLGSDYLGAAEADPSGSVFYSWRDALYTNMVSRQHPIARAQEALARVYRANTGETLNLLPQDDAYIRGSLASGSRAVAEAMLARGVRAARGTEHEGPSFQGAIVTAIGKRWTPEQWHDFGAYLTARSMVADYERFAAGEIPNAPGKLSAGDYAKAVGEYEARYPTFTEGAAQIHAFQTNLLQRHFDLGLFTKEYYDSAMARRDYVPKMRDMEDLGREGVSGSGRRDGASMMKAFRGSQRSVMNPLDAIHARVHELETAAAINETKTALARLAEITGPGSGFIAEPIPANKLSPVRVDVVDALRAAGSRANVDNLDLGALIHQAEGLLGDDVFSHIFRQEAIRPGQEPITFYYVNGERRALRLSDGKFGHALYNAMNTVTEPERNVFVSVLQIGQQVLRAGVTKSLGFIYRNPVRDQFTSVATGSRRYIPFVSAIQGLFDIATHGGDFERYLGFGGFGGGAIHEAVESSAFGKGSQAFRAKAWWDPRRITGVAAHGAELSEAATRAGLFQSYSKQAQGLGYDAFNTALYGTFNANGYVDFRRAGSDMAVVRRFVPFLGATIQGTDKEARALIGDMVKLEAKRARGEELSRAEVDQLQTSRVAWVKTLGLGLVFGGGTAYLNAQDPEWFGAAPWRRHRAYNFFPAGPEGNWASAPKPFGLVRNISDTFEYGVEYLFRQDPTLFKKWGEALADAHSVPYTNPFIDVFYSARSNYDAFRDRAIVPPSLQALPASEQYTRYTSEIAKGIGQVTGWSPMKTDYVAKSLGGGQAIDWLRNSDALIHWWQDKPGGKQKTIWDLPLAREMVQNLSVGSEATTRFYSLVGQKAGSLEQAATAYGQKVATGDRTGAETYLRGLPANERAYATLQKQGFDASDKLLHPLVLARAYNAVIAGVSRAIGDRNLIPEGDLDRSNLTLSRRDARPIEVSGPTGESLRNALDAYAMVTARNALIAFGADGMQGVPVKDPAEFLDRIKLLSPDVARELRGRLAAKRLYDPAVVAEKWPEAKARLLKDGENADLSDLLPRRPKSGTRERKRAMSDE